MREEKQADCHNDSEASLMGHGLGSRTESWTGEEDWVNYLGTDWDADCDMDWGMDWGCSPVG